MKFICNGKVLNDSETIPYESNLIALAIENTNSNTKNI